MANNNIYKPLDNNGRFVPFFKLKLRDTAQKQTNRKFYEATPTRTAQWMPNNYIKRSVNNGYDNALRRQLDEKERRDWEEKYRRETRDYLQKEATKDMYNLTEEQYQYAKKTALDESAKNREDAEFARKIYYGRLNARDDLNALEKWRYKVSDILGTLAENSSNGGIKESLGRIAIAKTNKQAADAYEYLQALQAYGSYRASLSEDEYKKSGGRQDLSLLGLPFIDGSIDLMEFNIDGKKYKGYNGLYYWLKKKGEEYDKQGMSNKDIIELANSYERVNVPKRKKTSTLNVYDRRTSRELQQELDLYDNPSQGFDMENTFARKLQGVELYKHQQDNDIRAEEESLYKGTTIAGALKEPLRLFGVESYDVMKDNSVGNFAFIPSKMYRKQVWSDIWKVSEAGRRYGNTANNLDWKDSDFWVWGMTAQYGYSVSSGAGIAGLALSWAGIPLAAAASSVSGPAGGLVTYNVAQLLAAPLNYQGGVGENYQEIADKWGDNYKQNLARYFKTDNLGGQKAILGIKNLAINKAIAGGLSKEEAKRMYDTSTDEGLNNVLGAYLTGLVKSNDMNLAKATVGTTKGLKQQFMADNMRTMASEGLQTAISLINPTKGIPAVGNAITRAVSNKLAGTAVAKAVNKSIGFAEKIGNAAAKTKAGRLVKDVVIDPISNIKPSLNNLVSDVSKYANNSTGKAMQTGAKIGGATSDILGGGILGRGIGETVGGVAGATVGAVKNKMSESMSAGLVNTAQNIANKFELYGRFFRANTKLGRFGRKTVDAFEKFAGNHPVASYLTKILAQKGWRSARASVVDHFSEGNEELVQYANSKEDFAKTYGYNYGNFADLLIHDFAQGGKVAKFYAAYLGIGESELLDDAEAVSNWKGGFFLGGLHPTIMANVAFGAHDLYKTGAAYNALATSTVFNREQDQNTRANNAILADQVTRGRFDQTMTVIDELERRDKQRLPNLRLGDDQYWNSKRENLRLINGLVNNKTLTQKLEALGIQRGTLEYYTAIADRANVIQAIIDNRKESEARSMNLELIYSSKTFLDEVNKLLDDVENAESPIAARNRAIEIGNKFVEQYVKDHMAENEERWKQNEERGFTETVANEKKQKEALYRKEAEEKKNEAVSLTLRSERINNEQRIKQISHIFNRLQGLLDLRAQMNTADDWFKFSSEKLGLTTSRPDAKLLSKNIDEQIKQAKKDLLETTKDNEEKYDASSDDLATLDFVNDKKAIGYNNKDIQDAEKYNAILQANEELYNQQLNAIDSLVVKNKDGKYEYNPEEAAYLSKLNALRLAQGKNYKEDKNHKVAESKDPKESYVYKRTKGILDAQRRNDSIDWAVADIAAGDNVTDITDLFMQQQQKQQLDVVNAYNDAVEQARDQSKTELDKRELAQLRSEERRKKFEEKRKLARERYRLNSKRHRNARRKRMHSDITGGIAASTFAVIQDVADKLIELALIGYYRYQRFRDDIKDIIDTNEIDGNELTKIAKAVYINAYLNGGKKLNMDKPIDVQLDGDVKSDAITLDRNYLQNGDKQLAGDRYVKTVLQSYLATIAFNNETGKYEVYHLIKDPITEGFAINLINSKDGLKFLESDLNFMSKISKELFDAIKDIYNKGITLELALAISVIYDDLTQHTRELLHKANLSRNMICEFFVKGLSQDEIDAYQNQLGDVSTVIQYCSLLRDRFNKAGYSVLDTRRPILGINLEGNKVQIEADLVLMNNNGDIMVVDVYTTSMSNTPYDLKSKSTRLAQSQDLRMRNISELLYNSIGSNFIGYYTLPVLNYGNGLYSGGRGFVVTDTYTEGFNRKPSEIVPELDQSIALTAAQLAEKYNLAVNQLNSIYELLNLIDGQNRTTEQLDKDLLSFNNKAEALLLHDAVLLKLAIIQDEIERALGELTEKLTPAQKQYTREEEFIPEEESWYPEDTTAINVVEAYNDILNMARNLDNILNNTPNLKVTSKRDRDQVNSIIYAIYALLGSIDNLYYLNQNTEGVNVKSEQDLINNAINKLVEYSDVLGVSKQQIAQWWSTLFATNYGNQYYTYYTKLKSFVDTFRLDFFDTMVGNPDLQAFWSLLLNNILLNYHIKNAKSLIENYPTQDSTFNNNFKDIISRCERLVQYFNDRFNVDPNVDTSIDVNSIESINDIDINWVELHSSTDKHFASFLSRDRNWKQYNKVATDPYLIKKDPSGKQGSLEFLNQNGRLVMKVVSSKGEAVYLNFDLANDRGPKGVDPRYMLRKVLADKKFENKVLLMLDYISKHPGYHLEYKVSRSKGSLRNGSEPINVSAWLMNSYGNKQDLYTIKFGKDSNIGVVEDRIDNLTRQVKKYIFGGEGLRQSISPYDTKYDKGNSISQGGNIVYLFHPGNAEADTKKVSERIPSPLINARISLNQSIELARMIYALSVNGATTYKGYDIMSMLKLVLYVYNGDRLLTEHNSTNSMVRIAQNGYVAIGNRIFDLRVESGNQQYGGRTQFIQALQLMYVANNTNFLNNNINDYINKFGDSALSKVKQEFMYGNSDSITLPNGLTFTREDFTHDGVGTTGLGYFLRNGILYTTVNGISAPTIYVSDVKLVLDAPKTSAEDASKLVLKELEQKKEEQYISAADLFLEENKDLVLTSKEYPTFMEAMQRWLMKVVGETAEFTGTEILSDTPNSRDNVVLAKCTQYVMQMSNSVPYTAGFHEAFHKVFELLVEPDVRDKIYELYKKYNKDAVTDRDIAEGLADLFVDYMSGEKVEKQLRKYGVVKRVCKKLFTRVQLLWKYGFGGALIIRTFGAISKGKYASKQATEQAKLRFEQKFGESLHYEINGQEFTQIANSADKQEMAKALGYMIVKSAKDSGEIYNALHKFKFDPYKYISYSVIKNLTGYGAEGEPTPSQAAFREIFDVDLVEYLKNATEQQRVESLINSKFAAFAPEIEKYVSTIMDAYDGKRQDDIEDNTTDEFDNTVKHQEDRYDKASFEFDKLDSVSKPVKFFFATVPYMVFKDLSEKNSEPLWTLDTSKNKYGCPTFMGLQEVYNIMCKRYYNIKDIHDLLERFRKDLSVAPMYKYLYDLLKSMYDQVYQYNYEGDLVHIDYDKEAIVTLIFNAIKGHVHDFIIGQSSRQGGMNVKVSNAGYDRDAAAYPQMWNTFLASGLTGLTTGISNNAGEILLATKINIRGNNVKLDVRPGENQFVYIAQFFKQLRESISNDGLESALISGRVCDFETNSGIESIKRRCLSWLQLLGILMSPEALNNMLVTKYGNSDRDGVTLWLTNAGKTSIDNFLTNLNLMVRKEGVTTQLAIDLLYSTGFISELGQYIGIYNKLTTDCKVNGVDGKSLHNISQNNAISELSDNYNTGDKNNAVIQTLLNYSYNITNMNGFAAGSIVAKAINSGHPLNIHISTPIGFKSDNRNDNGTKYSELPEADDYINKFAMILAGYAIFPTLADKGTYMVLSGIPIPGMQFTPDINGSGAYYVQNAPTIQFRFSEGWKAGMDVDDSFYMKPSDVVINQFIEYAYTEREAILEAREQLGMHVDNPKGLPLLADNEKIANYHTKRQGGIRFNLLTTLRVPLKDGTIKEFRLSEMSPDEQLKTANELFFNKSLDEQVKIMTLTLLELAKLEVLKAISLGIIKYSDSDKSMLSGLQNVNLNSLLITALALKFRELLKSQMQGYNITEKWLNDRSNSLAIMAILQDATYRSMIAAEECNRLYIGNHAFFKSVEDVQKRIGGLVSTGEDNLTNLPQEDGSTNDLYTCAEIKSYEIGSTSECIKTLENDMIQGELKTVYGDLFGYDEVDKDGFDVEAALVKEIGTEKVNDIKDNAEKFYLAYTKEINVADGASYISADFCKRLLRARGAFNNKIQKAFEILTGEDCYSWQDKRDAFDAIYNEVNFVTTKYTAYGFRNHTANGNDVQGGLAIPYYNKFALFPLFECLATGKMKGVYDMMKERKIDNLLTVDAIKIGQQGAVSFDGEKIAEPLTTYTQRLAALRRQLNTDPEEGDAIAAGTQMIKIALSNLRLDRKYGGLTGEQIRDKFMDSINELSKRGVEKFKNRFYTNEVVDQRKLSKYLIEQLGSRGANKNLIDALTIDESTGKMKAPIAATLDASWMESMLISAANKDIINITTPGSSYVQRSIFAMEGSLKDGEGKIVGALIYDGKLLLMINKEGSMDAVISINYFENILPKRPMSFNEKRQWLIDHGIIGENAKASTIGYRIPTQAQSSIHALRFVDVVSAVKDTIILPAEFTKITGSDFDIDHLYLCSKNFNVKPSVGGQEKSTEELQNEIIDCMLTVLKDDKTRNILYKSIDNDTSLVKNIAKEIPEEGNTKSVAYNFGTLHEQCTRKNDYITGKVGIGPFALNVTNHILTTLYGVRFKSTTFTEMTGITGFDKFLDEKNNQISSWLSAFINAHVDIVKDPYISKLNVNSFTYNMINLLARNGKGEAGLYFLCQPIIRQMAKANIDSKSLFTRDPKLYRSTFEMYNDKIKKMFPDITGGEFNLDEINSIVDAKYKGAGSMKANIVNDVLTSPMLKEIAKNPNLIYTDNKYKEFLKKCYLAWCLLEPYSASLNKLVQYTKIDTRKQGKNFIEMMAYRRNYSELILGDKSLFDMETINNLVLNTWIDLKTREAIDTPINVMYGSSFLGSALFMNKVNEMAVDFSNKFGRDPLDLRTNTKVLKKISLQSSSYIKVKYFSDLAKELNIDVKGLFDGNRTISDRINALRICMQRDAYGLGRLENNYLLSHIRPYVVDNTKFAVSPPKFIEVINAVNEDKSSADMFIESWEELLNDPVKNVRYLARDLIFYAMFTSGDTKGFNKLAKYIPMSWLELSHSDNMPTFVEYIRLLVDDPVVDFDAVAQNNYFDSDLISRTTFDKFDYINTLGVATVLIEKEAGDMPPTYISVRGNLANYNDLTQYFLYKNCGNISVNGNVRNVYALVPKKGYKIANGLQIYEYGDIGLDINGPIRNTDLYMQQFSKLQQYLNNDPYVRGNGEKEAQDAFDDKLKYITSRFNDPDSDFAVQLQELDNGKLPEITQHGRSTSNQEIWVVALSYYKGLPQKHPDVLYAFTENALAYSLCHGLDMSIYPNPSTGIKINVYGLNNTACIRTDESGVLSKNAIGIVVKLYLLDLNGRFVAQEGCYPDTNLARIHFAKMLNDGLSRVDKSKPIVLPSSMAMGRAALPKPFAEYLAKRLTEEFNVVCLVLPNNKTNYNGYGVNILGLPSDGRKAEFSSEEKIQSSELSLTDEEVKQGEQYKKECKGGK